MNQNNFTYFDFIPDELILIIYSYLEPNNFLSILSQRYQKIFNEYVNIIKKGFIMPFKILKPEDLKIYEYVKKHEKILPYDGRSIIDKQRIYSKLPSTVRSTSNYLEMGWYEKKDSYEFFFYNLVNFFHLRKSMDFLTQDINLIIYANSEFYDKTSTLIIKFLYVSNVFNDNLYKIKIYVYNGKIENLDYYESYNWKDIWDKLTPEDQNAILYQNEFSIKN